MFMEQTDKFEPVSSELEPVIGAARYVMHCAEMLFKKKNAADNLACGIEQ